MVAGVYIRSILLPGESDVWFFPQKTIHRARGRGDSAAAIPGRTRDGNSFPAGAGATAEGRPSEIYLDIKTAFEGGDYEEVAKKLVHFRSSLQAHLLTENVRLYIYLSHSLANDEINSELIHEFRREMDAIARVAMNFLKKYDTIGVDKELAGAFAKDFATIGQVLTERIEKEERVLYPLYLPCY